MTIKRIENSVEGAVELLLSDYKRQTKILNYLPEAEVFRDNLSKKTDYLFNNGSGFAFYEDNTLAGFISGYKIKKYFGSANGVYVPITGHSVSPEISDRERYYRKMYAYAANEWVKEALFSHVITVFASDKSLVDTWFDLGFGNRCVDSICVPSELDAINSNITVKMAKKEDLDSIDTLWLNLQLHLNKTPMFMPRKPEPIQSLKEWLEDESSYLWIAYLEEKPVGFIKIEAEGENYITEHPTMMNITGAYVDELVREKAIGATLLNAVHKFLLDHNYKLCGVDFESFNISGNGFWNRYFTPYTYSLARRIDENIRNI